MNYNNDDRIEKCNSRLLQKLLTSSQTVSNTYALAAHAQSCTNHVQHIKRLCANHVQHVVCHAVRRTLTEFIFSFSLLTEMTNRRIRGGNEGIRCKPLTTSLKKNATYLSPKIQAPSETRTRTLALVAGYESGRANHYTTGRPRHKFSST